jgi:hypothetical protein
MAEIFDSRRINVANWETLSPAQRSAIEGELSKIQKVLGRARIACKVPDPNSKGKWLDVQKSTAGLATGNDGPKTPKKGERETKEMGPRFAPNICRYPNAYQVKFWLRAPKPNPDGSTKAAPKGLDWNSYVRVSDYYKFSK